VTYAVHTTGGRLVAAASFDDAHSDADGAVAAAELFDAMKGMIASGASLSPDFHVVGRRPIPKDGFPAVERAAGIPGLYTAVMHSGITLAPVIGHFVADELLTGRRESLLEPYGLGRLL
jgi:glycine/D-amino acid oxidase-like deaminating enzyme